MDEPVEKKARPPESLGKIAWLNFEHRCHSALETSDVREDGTVVLRRKLRRSQVLAFFAACPPCLVGLEACAGAHYWARELIALGHDVRIMPAAYVKPYVKRGKTDAADAEAICEAVTRPTMRFVPVKSAARQGALVDHKTRDFLVCRVPDDQIDPRRSALFMARSILREVRDGGRAC